MKKRILVVGLLALVSGQSFAYMMPETGRWASRDPIGVHRPHGGAASSHGDRSMAAELTTVRFAANEPEYVMAQNNPLTFSDMVGLYTAKSWGYAYLAPDPFWSSATIGNRDYSGTENSTDAWFRSWLSSSDNLVDTTYQNMCNSGGPYNASYVRAILKGKRCCQKLQATCNFSYHAGTYNGLRQGGTTLSVKTFLSKAPYSQPSPLPSYASGKWRTVNTKDDSDTEVFQLGAGQTKVLYKILTMAQVAPVLYDVNTGGGFQERIDVKCEITYLGPGDGCKSE